MKIEIDTDTGLVYFDGEIVNSEMIFKEFKVFDLNLLGNIKETHLIFKFEQDLKAKKLLDYAL